MLWGDVREPQARRGLRQALFTLRKAVITEPPAFLIKGDTVALNADAVDVDVVEFQRLVAESTPTARVPSSSTRCTSALVTTVRLARFCSGRR